MRRSIKRRFAVLMALIMMLSVTPMQTLTEGFIEFSIISNMSLTPGVYPTDGDQPADQLVDASTNEITNPRYVWLYTDGGVTYLYVSITLNTGNSVILFQVDGVNGSFVHTIGQNNDISVNNTPYNPNIKGNNNHWEVWRVPISSLVLDGSYSITIHTTEGQGHWLIGVPFHVAMSIDKTANKTQYSALGEIITYTVVLKNNGDQVLTGVTLADSLAPNVTVGSPTESILADGKFVPGETWTYTYTYAVTAEDLANGSILNRATADNDQMSPVYDEVTVTAAPKVNISGTKTWEDNDDQDGLRPDKITVNLLADGMEVDEAEVEAPWSYSFTGLPKYRDGGVEIVYTVTEDPITGYTPSVDGYDILNTHTPEETQVSGTKTWEDNDDQDGLRPDKITVNLLADGAEVDEAEVEAPWSYSFTGLPKYRDGGVEIVYTVTEDPITGYTPSVDGHDILNTHTPEETQVSGTKTWEDNDDQDGLRPDKITVNLLADGMEVDEAEVEAPWSYSFTGLPKYRDGGVEIVYTVTEDPITGYTPSVDGHDILNTHTPEETQVSGTKTWEDNDDQDGLRPDKITVNLLADGMEVDEAEVEAPWSYSFTGLPKYRDGGVEIVYTVTEDPITGYTPSVDGHDILNTHTPEETQVSGTKTWEDNDDQDGLRPDKITVNLLADGMEVDEAEVEAPWSYSFTGLPKYRDGGVEIVYTVTEDPITGYTPSVDGHDILNTHTPEETQVSGTKTWEDNDDQDGLRPDKITVNLLADGMEVDEAEVEAPWSYSFTGLPKYRDGGVEIVYTVTEDPITGYTPSVDGHDILNTHTPEETQVSGTKTWEDNDDQDGLRPDKITVNLLADGMEVDEAEVEAPWSYSFTGLPKYRDGGVEIVYTVTEDPITGYTPSVDGHDILNTHTPEETQVSGTKTWEDNDDQDGLRPDKITVNLLADGMEVDEAEVEAPWSYSFTGLPKYRDGGVEIVYTVTEDPITGYTPSVDGHDILNTHTPEETQVSGTKTWEDNDDQDGLRPDKITVNLLADGMEVDEAEVEAPWSYSFTGLPKYRDGGVEIVYTVTEDPITGYTPSVDGHDILNTHTPEETQVSGTKTWEDNDDQDGLRPDKITVNLLADGMEVDEAEVEAPWSYSFTGLPKYRDGGVEIVYTVTEDPITGYTPSVDGHDILNTHTPEETQVSGTKTWEDNDDQDGLRPDKITVNLLADGMEVDEAEVEAPWSYSFTGLPKYRDGGVEIVYTVTEDPITGYTPSVDGHDILNTHTPETTTRTVQKIWEDNGVEDTLHTEVQLELIATADGDLVPWATLKAASASGALMDADGMVTLGPDAPLTHVFYNLPVYYQGDAITYTVDEPTVPGGYEKSIDELVVTNTRELTDDIPVLKIWEDQEDLYGLRPLSVTIHLMRSDDAITPYKQLVLNEGNGWMGTFADLPAKDGNGEMYTYSIHEERVPGYLEPAYGGIEGTQTVTNTLDTIDIPVDKIWDDMDDLHSLRPDDVTVELLQNGAPFIPAQTKTLSAPAWNTVFEGLPRKDASDIEYVYTLIETPVTGYLAPAYDEGEGGLEVVNTVDLISISGQKIWDDGDNNDAMRPANITVRLMSGAVEIDNRVVTAANGWAFQFANLPRFDESGLIHYTITEDAISGYTQLPIMQINAETGLESLSEEFTVNIINTHINETITLSGLKQWNHGANTAVPAAITVRVMAGAEQIAAQTIGAPWTYSFTGLPKFLDGVLISYTITEDVVPGYTTSIDQANGLIINTFIELPPAPEVPGEPDAGDGLIFLGAPTFNTGESFH